MEHSLISVTAVTVVYGTRWPLLEQVANACLSDSRFRTFVIVDNGCKDAVAMDAYAARFPGRVIVLRQEKNIGYSGAINKGLTFARDTTCDFIFVLDDDSVPETGAIDYFLKNLELFGEQKVILTEYQIVNYIKVQIGYKES